MNKILVCVDGSNLSKAVCDYGVDIAKKLDLPLVLLNVIEHSNISKKVNLSGNIGLGAKDDLLDKLANEEMNESKQQKEKGKVVLKEMQEYVKSQGFENCTTLQKHGTLYETLDDLSYDLKLAIIGLKGESNSAVGSHIEELIRTLNIPIFLINKEFQPINSMLMAYDGSEYAKKAIKIGKQNPIFPDIKRHLVNVNKNASTSHQLLNEAKQLFANANIDIKIASLHGESVDTILQYQQENSLDIIAMGAYSHNRFKSAIFGSFTSQMLLSSQVPLLLFR